MVPALSRLMLMAACLHSMRLLPGGDPSHLRNMGLRNVGLIIAMSMFQMGMAVPSNANTIIAICGDSSGYRYDFGIPDLKEEGWEKDTIAGGSTTFISTSDGYDVILKDAYGSKTATEENAEITMFESGKGAYNFVVKYPLGTIVVYSLSVPNGQKRKLLWSIARNGTGMGDLSGSMFVSDCS